MSKDVTMTCKLRSKPESLRIDYEIVNHSKRGVYAFVLPTDANMEPYHKRAYAALSGNRRVLYLVVDRTPVPADWAASGKKPARPLACYIKPEGSYEERFMVYHPVREWNAYATPTKASYGLSYEVSHALLSIVYVFEDEAERIERSTVPGFHEVGYTMGHKLVLTLQLDKPILVQAFHEDGVRMTF